MKILISCATKLLALGSCLILAPLSADSLPDISKLKIGYPHTALQTAQAKSLEQAALETSIGCNWCGGFQIPCCKKPPKDLSMSFDEFLLAVTIASTPAEKNDIILQYIQEVCTKNNGWPLVDYSEGGKTSRANFVYRPDDSRDIEEVLVGGEWNGFLNGLFGPRVNNQNTLMNRISLDGEYPDFFYFQYSFENDARLDYKFVVDGNYIFDPLNPLATPGGFGGNSTVVMPEYCPTAAFRYHHDIPHGKVLGAENIALAPKTTSPIGGNPSIDPNNENRTLDAVEPYIIPEALLSPYVGGALRDQGYWVYLPAEYKKHKKKHYPVVYFLDGQDYIQFGNMNNVLDYLIAKKCIEPVIAVFLRQDNCVTINNEPCSGGFLNPPNYDDPLIRDTENAFIATVDPDTGSLIQPYADYIINRLIPEIDANFRTIPKAKARVIVGDSATGNQSLYMALANPHYFKNAIIQSLAYQNANNSQPAVDDFVQAVIEGNTPSGTPPEAYTHGFLHGDSELLGYLGSFYPHAKDVKIYMNWGSYENPSYDFFVQIADTLLNNEIAPYLKEKAEFFKYQETHEGHNYAQWTRQVAQALPMLLEGKKPKKCEQSSCCSK